MSNRTAKLVSVMFASCLAGLPLATISYSAAQAADECLSGPKAQTPHGGHWYYRIDHATKRNCWYLGEEGGKVVQIVRPKSAQPATPQSQNAEAAIEPSIANAHAELSAPPNHDDALVPETPTNAAIPRNDGGIAAAQTQRSIVASRWPDPSDSGPPPSPTPDKRDPDTSAGSTSRTQPPIAAAVPIAAADLSLDASTYSVPMQFAALMGALAIAGIMVRVIFKFGSARRPANARARRAAIWQNANTDARTPSVYPRAPARARRPDVSRASYDAGDRDDRITEFFAQLSRRTPI
jgi:hypothetical protein